MHHISAGVLAKANDTFIGEPGAVLSGGGVAGRGIYGYGGATAQHDVRISNLIFEGFTVEAIQGGVGLDDH